MYLIISTDKNNCFSVARADKNNLSQITVNKPFKQTELLLKTILKLVEFKKIKGIIVNQGPGEFSALRIGIATTNALAFALDVPVVGVSIKPELELSEKEKINFLWHKGFSAISRLSKRKIILPYYDKEPNITVKK